LGRKVTIGFNSQLTLQALGVKRCRIIASKMTGLHMAPNTIKQQMREMQELSAPTTKSLPDEGRLLGL